MPATARVALLAQLVRHEIPSRRQSADRVSRGSILRTARALCCVCRPRNRWAADTLWPCGRQVAAVGAQSCENIWDNDVYPGSSGSITIGNGCSSSSCRGNSNNDCDAWHVQCASGRRARLTFEFFQTESNYDYLCARQLLLLRLVAQKASPSCLVPTVIPAPNAI